MPKALTADSSTPTGLNWIDYPSGPPPLTLVIDGDNSGSIDPGKPVVLTVTASVDPADPVVIHYRRPTGVIVDLATTEVSPTEWTATMDTTGLTNGTYMAYANAGAVLSNEHSVRILNVPLSLTLSGSPSPLTDVPVGTILTLTSTASEVPTNPVHLWHSLNGAAATDLGPMTALNPQLFESTFDTTGTVHNDTHDFTARSGATSSPAVRATMQGAPLTIVLTSDHPDLDVWATQGALWTATTNREPDDGDLEVYSSKNLGASWIKNGGMAGGPTVWTDSIGGTPSQEGEIWYKAVAEVEGVESNMVVLNNHFIPVTLSSSVTTVPAGTPIPLTATVPADAAGLVAAPVLRKSEDGGVTWGSYNNNNVNTPPTYTWQASSSGFSGEVWFIVSDDNLWATEIPHSYAPSNIVKVTVT